MKVSFRQCLRHIKLDSKNVTRMRNLSFQFIATTSGSRKYSHSSQDFEKSGNVDTVDTDTTYSAMLAYGYLKKPLRLRALVKKLADEDRSTIITAQLLLIGYCTSDRVELAEGILQAWLESNVYNISNVDDQSLQRIYEHLRSRTRNEKSNLLVMEDVANLSGFSDRIPWDSWCALAKMYCGRGAWQPCLHILTYLESVCAQEIQGNSRLEITYNKLRMTNPEASIGLSVMEVLSSVYQSTVSVLFRTHQLSMAVDVLRRALVHSQLQDVSSRMALATICISCVPQWCRSESSPSPEARVNDDQLWTQLIELTLSLASAPSTSLLALDSLRNNEYCVQTKTDKIAQDLLAELLSALCKRGKKRPAMVTESESGLIDEAKRCIDEVLKLQPCALSTRSTVIVIQGLSSSGRVKDACDLFTRMQMFPASARNPLLEEQAYHAICHAIRASGHVDHLARFMIAYQATKINR